MGIKRLVHPPKYTTANSVHILRTFKRMTLLIRVAQELMEFIHPEVTKILKDINKVVVETAQDLLITYRDKKHEVLAESEADHTIASVTDAHKVVLRQKINTVFGQVILTL